ncbi:hypothetical protein [Streptomyces stelliscabiei]|uniref:hypothetical protein n=1 Tax=Streptomyces stelliscabiei TaxID=146820 RepID=UPI0029AF4E75|nr:hypothetical protein [Streptomyces stelliscabiei]MDX2550127.1 hypothetical protein [Streptomyces stelliscabiei]
MGIHPDTTDPLPGISVPPGTILGYRADGRPIHVIAGGAETDDEPDIEAEPDGDPEPEPETGPEPDDKPKPKPPAKKDDPKPGDDDYEPPSKTEWARTQAALKKANDDAKRHRLRNKELEDKARGDETEHEKALREAREEGEKRYRTPLVRTAVRGALVEAGALAFLQDEKDPDSQPAREKGESRLGRLMKLVDLDGLDIDEDGSVAGLDAAVAELARDYPELFAVPARRPKARPTGAPRPAAVEKPKSTAELHANRILGRA